jgi:hypothetical protein
MQFNGLKLYILSIENADLRLTAGEDWEEPGIAGHGPRWHGIKAVEDEDRGNHELVSYRIKESAKCRRCVEFSGQIAVEKVCKGGAEEEGGGDGPALGEPARHEGGDGGHADQREDGGQGKDLD